ncbi:MAG: AI-2E family transporter [Victivallales bacterium]|nr:AI-2E family transporter [Victivallales bacterium]
MTDNPNDSRDWAPLIAKIAFLVLTVALVLAVIYLLRVVLHAIILGTLFAIILMPLHRRLTAQVLRFLKFRERKLKIAPKMDEEQKASRSRLISSMLMVCLVFFVIVIPLSAFMISVAKQGAEAIPKTIQWIRKDMVASAERFYSKNRTRLHLDSVIGAVDGIITNYFSEEAIKEIEGKAADETMDVVSQEDETASATKEKAAEGTPDAVADASDGEGVSANEPLQEPPDGSAAKKKDDAKPNISPANLSKFVGKIIVTGLNALRKSIMSILAEAGIIIFNFFIMLFVMFHIFLDGDKIWKFLLDISPFSEEDQRHIVNRIKNVSRAIFFSIFGTAIIQGTLAAIAFRIVGIPALFWGVLLGLCSVIPFVGTGLVWVPVTIYLFLTEQFGCAVFILVFCGGIVANIDSIIRPFLMKHGGKTGMSYMVLFFSIMGGLQTFGLIGIIYGPIIMGMCGICVLIFSTHFKNIRHDHDENME